jgi:transposase InsO family protein
VLAHDRRRILHIEVTDHPSALWLACQIAEALRFNPAPLFLLRDNDGLYGAAFRDQLRALGLDDRPTMPHSPWQNGHVERLIGSIRRECLDHVVIWNAAHLRCVLRDFADYYNNDRTHLALAKNSPNARAREHEGRITATPILGGLHHRYRRKGKK